MLRVNGVPAFLERVHVELSSPLTIDHASLFARRLVDGDFIEERIEP